MLNRKEEFVVSASFAVGCVRDGRQRGERGGIRKKTFMFFKFITQMLHLFIQHANVLQSKKKPKYSGLLACKNPPELASYIGMLYV